MKLVWLGKKVSQLILKAEFFQVKCFNLISSKNSEVGLLLSRKPPRARTGRISAALQFSNLILIEAVKTGQVETEQERLYLVCCC